MAIVSLRPEDVGLAYSLKHEIKRRLAATGQHPMAAAVRMVGKAQVQIPDHVPTIQYATQILFQSGAKGYKIQ